MLAEGCGWLEFSTHGVPLARRLESWSEATNQIFPPTRVRRPGNEGFYGRVAWKRFGALTLADIVSTDLEVLRSRREIREREEECFELNIQMEGHGSLSQGGRDAETDPRSMVLCDSRKPYEMSFRGPYRQLSLKMPRELLRERLPAADALVAQRVPADGVPRPVPL